MFRPSASDLLYVFVIVRLARRDLVWINVTPNPTAEWVARQITEAFPWAEAPRYLICDRDRVYGAVVTRRLRAMGIRDKPIAPASPWQNGFAERLIGSIRRECVDHFVVLSEAHLRRILQAYARYYDEIRTYRSLNKDAPTSRPVERSEASPHMRCSANSIITMCGFRFSVHTMRRHRRGARSGRWQAAVAQWRFLILWHSQKGHSLNRLMPVQVTRIQGPLWF